MKKCKYCNREFEKLQSLKTHEFRCKQNPNYFQNNERYTATNKKFIERIKNKPSPYFDYVSKCQKCGKEFTQRTTQSLINHNKHKRCCCSKCAHSRIHTVETRKKTSASLNKFFASKGRSNKSLLPDENKNCKNLHKNYKSKEIVE